MCVYFSCIVEEGGKVYWKKGVDSHSEIEQMFKLNPKTDETRAKVECRPPHTRVIVDELRVPVWWTKEYEGLVKQALQDEQVFTGQAIDVYESKRWYKNGKLHRLDGPAIELADGIKEWFKDGKRHRLDGPAIERADGTKEWYKNGKRHRLYGPAIKRADGRKSWFKNGLFIK